MIRLPAAGSLLVLGACGKSDRLVCYDPAKVNAGDASLRNSLHYTESSPHADKSCSGCGFFQAAQPAGCGECTLLKGPVNAKGYCDSWSAKTS
jgi:hypothetical protein